MREDFERTIERVGPVASGAAEEFRAGAAEKDITPHFCLAMAGYSAESVPIGTRRDEVNKVLLN